VRRSIVLALVLVGCRTIAPEGRERQEVFERSVPVRLRYLVQLPQQVDTSSRWPLILFLHGAGERGDDLEKLKRHGPPKIAAADPTFPFIVVSPLCPEGGWWESAELAPLLDEVVARYPVDPDRVYLTGLSMGGFGAFDLAARVPDRFAAIAPMAGGGNPVLARRLKGVPVWVFHGEEDKTVPIRLDEQMVEALEAAGAEVRFTRYAGKGHTAWIEAYADPELYRWFLAHALHRGP
jgi:predicted peptidase